MIKYFHLIKEFAMCDFKIRYQESVLGYLWSFIKPLLIFGTLYIIFSVFLKFNIQYYPVYLFLGIILWNFFVEATSFSMKNLIGRGDIIKKIYFPRDIIVVSSVFNAFFTLLLNFFVFAIFFVVAKIPVSKTIVLLPLFTGELFFISLGAGLFLAALNVKFRDLTHIWDILLQMGFWATPIIYSINMVPQKYHFALYLNPMTRIIQYSRNVVIEGKFPQLDGIIASLAATLAVFYLGYFVFKKLEPYFAEEF